jgi:hypothetical protein
MDAIVYKNYPFKMGLLLLALLLLLLPEKIFSIVPSSVAIWMGFFLITAITAIAFRSCRLRAINPWLHPTSAFAAFFLFFYGIGLLSMYYWDSLAEIYPNLFQNVPGYDAFEDIWSDISRLTLLGGTSILFGTMMRASTVAKMIPSIRWNFSKNTFFQRSLYYLPIVLVTYTLMPIFRSYIPKPLEFLLQTFGFTGYFVIIIASYYFFLSPYSRKKWIIIYILYGILMAIPGLIVQMRGQMLTPFFVGIFGFIMARGRLPKKGILVIAILALIFILPWATFIKKTGSSEQGIFSRVKEAGGLLADIEYYDRLSMSFEASFKRFSGPNNIGHVRSWVPGNFPHQNGRVFWITLQSLIPRQLWFNKPNVSEELNWFSRTLLYIQVWDNDTSAVFDALGLYYLDFGVFGIFFLGLLHGWIIRLLFDWLSLKRFPYEFAASFFLFSILVPSDLSPIIIWLSAISRYALVSLLVLYFLSNGHK